MAQPVQPAPRRAYPWSGGAFPWTPVFLLLALALFLVGGLLFMGWLFKANVEHGLACVAFGLASMSIANLRG
jgi:hypothetical protein